jgi:XTP/dITP diphosphohydrolase
MSFKVRYYTPMRKIILASNNKGKMTEFNALLKGVCEVVSMSDGGVKEVPEIGRTFVENALIKARNASAQSGLPALADDSGIVVDALDGAPGIYSARYGGNHGNEEANTQKLLAEMRSVADGQRSARFWCAVVFVEHANDPTPIIIQRGWEGEVLREKVGNNGFGYDPIFYLPTQGCTSAELAPEVKNTISHRAKALTALLEELKVC